MATLYEIPATYYESFIKTFSKKLDDILDTLNDEQDILEVLKIVVSDIHKRYIGLDESYLSDTEFEEELLDILSNILKKIKEGKLKVAYFTDNSIKILKEIIYRSENREYSVNLCIYKNKLLSEIFVNYIIKEGKSSIKITPRIKIQCDKDKEIISNFRTHPTGHLNIPSLNDLFIFNSGNRYFDCIGTNKTKNKISCFAHKHLSLLDNINERNNLLFKINQVEEIRIKSHKYKQSYRNKLFNYRQQLYNELLNRFYNQFNPEEIKYIILETINDGKKEVDIIENK